MNGSANEKFGIAKSLSVMPGDVIQAEVFAKYVDPNSSNWTGLLPTLMSQIAAGQAGVVYDGAGYSSSTTSFPYPAAGTGTPSPPAPKAYLNWIVFDRNFVQKTFGYTRITSASREYGQDVAHEQLSSPSITITEAGYVYIYLSNEETTPIEVYFDDFKVTHTKSPVVQVDDYYPFGLTFNSFQRENSTINRWKFQGQEHVDDLGLNWDSFKWRNHQPEIGRFLNVDPLSEEYMYNSPYAFSENQVIAFRELEGLEKISIHMMTVEPNKTEYRSPSQAGTNPSIPKNTTFGNLSVYQSNTSLSFKVDISTGEVSNTQARNQDKSFLTMAFDEVVNGDVYKADFQLQTEVREDGSLSINGSLEGASFLMSISKSGDKLDVTSQMKNVPKEDAALIAIGDGDQSIPSNSSYITGTKQGEKCFVCGNGDSSTQKSSVPFSVDPKNNVKLKDQKNDEKGKQNTVRN